jgi:hypothetical protein
MTSAGEACLVGSLMQKDRFSHKPDDKYKFVLKKENGASVTNPLVEAGQFAFNYPGPIVASTLVAFATNHGSIMEQFFHLV